LKDGVEGKLVAVLDSDTLRDGDTISYVDLKADVIKRVNQTFKEVKRKKDPAAILLQCEGTVLPKGRFGSTIS